MGMNFVKADRQTNRLKKTSSHIRSRSITICFKCPHKNSQTLKAPTNASIFKNYDTAMRTYIGMCRLLEYPQYLTATLKVL